MCHKPFMYFLIHQLKGLTNRQKIHLFKKISTSSDLSLSSQFILNDVPLTPYQKKEVKTHLADLLSRSEAVHAAFLGNKFVTWLDDDYPGSLRVSHNPPALIYYQGDISLLKTPCLAVVGSREPSRAAYQVVSKLLPDLVAAKLTIVSGLARGIDQAVHKETMTHNGRTIAVLGNGIDVCYPKEGRGVQREIGEKHLLISEYPAGSQPQKWRFPARNRLIAGLSLGTCVIEAKARSGSLITAEVAIENGREVFAVPGSIIDDKSQGCHDLIKDGAKCVTNSTDIFEELGPFLDKSD